MRVQGIAIWFLWAMAAHPVAAVPQVAGDSTHVVPVAAAPPAVRFLFSPFDTIAGTDYSRTHSLSLGHYLEFVPGYFLERLGPIGADAAFSRYAIGGGRGAVYLGRVLLNDPQNDRAPLAMIPTTAVGRLVRDGNASAALPTHSDIEGVLTILEPAPLNGQPATAIEVATGDRGLKQRRVRFSSASGSIGIDFSYDELRNDGYSFDSRGLVGGRDFGSSTSRTQSLNLRGNLPGGEDYLFAFRRFTSTFQGDLSDINNEQRRNGHYGMLQSSVRGIELTAYERGYEVTTPDSLTRNQTTALVLNFPVFRGNGESFTLGLAYEDIVSRQEVGGGLSDDRLQEGSIGASGRLRLGAGFGAAYGLNMAHQFNRSSEWGARASVARRLGAGHVVTVQARRSFRLPNLGELFLPVHAAAGSPGTNVGGNRDLDGETALELRGLLYDRIGVFENEIRGGVMRVDEAITPSGSSFVTLRNGSPRTLRFVEDRIRSSGSWRGVDLAVTGAAEYTTGDKAGFFELVPDYRLSASLKVGRPFFKNTSSLFVTTQYQYNDSRTLAAGGKLGSFGVLNVRADARLVSAQLYVLWLNALDKRYQTISPYLMTPRTVVFGVSWTFLN
ncbi:MAG: TonB-dependent receptor [Candidatus Krumholzibacteriia bacterium]